MILTLLLPWFPIVLAVGVGGRLLGRSRGLGLGILCALFWIVLVQASVGSVLWHDPWTVATLMSGAIAIAAMGLWSGSLPDDGVLADRSSPLSTAHAPAARFGAGRAAADTDSAAWLGRICMAVDRFDDWLHEHRDDGNPWPKFDEFLRSILYECCLATHAKPYRLVSADELLTPLSEPDPLGEEEHLSSRRGILGHVVTTGRSYLVGDPAQGESVAQLAAEDTESIAWCFSIRQGSRRLGVVAVGRLGLPPQQSKPLLETMARLVNQFWSTLAETSLSRSATQIDPVSGLPTRAAFLRSAEESLKESYRLGEPVALVVVALEGLREINDSGRWEVADDLIRSVCDALRRQVRMDDRLGRFDGSRIVLLLRRVDSQLAMLIVKQMVSRVTAVSSDELRWDASVSNPARIDVRVGVTGSGTEAPALRTLISQALQQCRRARVEKRWIASNLDPASDLEAGSGLEVARGLESSVAPDGAVGWQATLHAPTSRTATGVST